jgi:hypothetical protein
MSPRSCQDPTSIVELGFRRVAAGRPPVRPGRLRRLEIPKIFVVFCPPIGHPAGSGGRTAASDDHAHWRKPGVNVTKLFLSSSTTIKTNKLDRFRLANLSGLV